MHIIRPEDFVNARMAERSAEIDLVTVRVRRRAGLRRVVRWPRRRPDGTSVT